jgi:broad specificity phosphatase PhoE
MTNRNHRTMAHVPRAHQTMMAITKYVLEINHIRTREELDEWCGSKRRQRLYEFIQSRFPEEWSAKAMDTIRIAYRNLLQGFSTP